MHEHLESLYPDSSRFPEIERILQFIKEGLSVQMIAAPGVGRSNVCKLLVYNHNIRVKHLGQKQTSYHFVFINFAEIKNRPIFDAVKFIFLELVSSLNERRFDAFSQIDTLFKRTLSYHDELVLFEGLKDAIDILAHEYNIHTVLLFERFELYIPKLTEEFFINLRSLRDRAKYKFSVIFSVNRPLEETLDPQIMADFYEFFGEHYVYLTLLDNPGIIFRIEHVEKITGEKLGKDLIESLTHLTGGHGKLMRLGTEAILAVEDKTTLPTKHLENFLLSQRTVQKTLKEIWDFLTPFEKNVFLKLSLSVNDPSVNVSALERDSEKFIQNVGLIQNDQIAIPLFKTWIKENSTKENAQNQPIFYDLETNTIRKGELVISDTLTASEFRLLQFFLENPEKVLERDEVISRVWKDTATTIGVTEQALDQLIFRLRKKIEDNPNAPTHIITVKGRGVKYIP